MRYYEITIQSPCPREAEKICKNSMYRMSIGGGVTFAFRSKKEAMGVEDKLIAMGAKFLKKGKPFVPSKKEEG